MSNSGTTYRAVGFSDQEVCEQCGRDSLKRTVALDVLDADGIVLERVHFGTTCAARATGRKAAAIVIEAEQSERAFRTAQAEVASTVEHLQAIGDTAYGIARELRCRAREIEQAPGGNFYGQCKVDAYRLAAEQIAA